METSLELRGGTAAPPRARPDRRGVRPYPEPARARPERLRARRLLAPLVGALRLQALGPPAEAVSDGRPGGAAGPGRERRRRSTSARARRARSRWRATTTPPPSSPSRAPPPASAGSSATSSRWARGRSPSSTACASARRTSPSTARSAGSAHYGNCVGVPTVGRRGGLRRRLPAQPARQRHVRRPPPGRARHAARARPGRATSSSSTAPRPVATASAAPASLPARSSRTRTTTSARPCRSATRSPGKKLIEASLELTEGRTRRVAPGPRRRRPRLLAGRDGRPWRRRARRPPRPRARCASRTSRPSRSWSPRARSAWWRSSLPLELAAVEAVCRKWELDFAVDRRGHGLRRAARVLRRRGGGRDPGRVSSPTRRRATTVETAARELAPPLEHEPKRVGRDELLALLASPNVRSRRPVFERYDHLVGSRTVRRPGLDAAVLRLRPSLRGPRRVAGRPRARGAPRSRGAAAPAPSSRRRATSPALAGGRWRSPTASTSATRRSPRSRGSSPRRSRAWRARARCSGSRSSRATSRSTTRPTAARSLRRRSSAASASSPTSGSVPGRLARGRRVVVAGGGQLSRWTGPSTRRSSWTARQGGRPPPDYVAEAALVRFLWRSAPASVPRTTSPTAASRSRSPSWPSTPGSARSIELEREALRVVRRGRGAGGDRVLARASGGARGRAAAPTGHGRRRQAARCLRSSDLACRLRGRRV